MRWGRVVIRRAVITVSALGGAVIGVVQQDRLLIVFGVVALAASAVLCGITFWSWRAQRVARERG